ncbi:hypothetical protein [Streptomyces sp. NPDC015125]
MQPASASASASASARDVRTANHGELFLRATSLGGVKSLIEHR